MILARLCVTIVFLWKNGDDDFTILLFYVDDILIVGQDASKIDNLKRELNKSFTMKDLGLAKQIIDMKISRDQKSKKLWLFEKNICWKGSLNI